MTDGKAETTTKSHLPAMIREFCMHSYAESLRMLLTELNKLRRDLSRNGAHCDTAFLSFMTAVFAGELACKFKVEESIRAAFISTMLEYGLQVHDDINVIGWSTFNIFVRKVDPKYVAAIRKRVMADHTPCCVGIDLFQLSFVLDDDGDDDDVDGDDEETQILELVDWLADMELDGRMKTPPPLRDPVYPSLSLTTSMAATLWTMQLAVVRNGNSQKTVPLAGDGNSADELRMCLVDADNAPPAALDDGALVPPTACAVDQSERPMQLESCSSVSVATAPVAAAAAAAESETTEEPTPTMAQTLRDRMSDMQRTLEAQPHAVPQMAAACTAQTVPEPEQHVTSESASLPSPPPVTTSMVVHTTTKLVRDYLANRTEERRVAMILVLHDLAMELLTGQGNNVCTGCTRVTGWLARIDAGEHYLCAGGPRDDITVWLRHGFNLFETPHQPGRWMAYWERTIAFSPETRRKLDERTSTANLLHKVVEGGRLSYEQKRQLSDAIGVGKTAEIYDELLFAAIVGRLSVKMTVSPDQALKLLEHGFHVGPNEISWDDAGFNDARADTMLDARINAHVAQMSTKTESSPVSTSVAHCEDPPACGRPTQTTAQLLRLYEAHRTTDNRARAVEALLRLDAARVAIAKQPHTKSLVHTLVIDDRAASDFYQPAVCLLREGDDGKFSGEAPRQMKLYCSNVLRDVWISHGFQVDGETLSWAFPMSIAQLVERYAKHPTAPLFRRQASEALEVLDMMQQAMLGISGGMDYRSVASVFLAAAAVGYRRAGLMWNLCTPMVQLLLDNGFTVDNDHVISWDQATPPAHVPMETPALKSDDAPQESVDSPERVLVKREAPDADADTVEQSKRVRAAEAATTTEQWKRKTGKPIPSTAQLLRLYAANTKSEHNKMQLDLALDQLDCKLGYLSGIMRGTVGMQLIEAANQHEFSITATSCVPERARQIWINHGFTVQGSSISWHLPGSVAQVLCRYSEHPSYASYRCAALDAMDILDELQHEEFGCHPAPFLIPYMNVFLSAAAAGSFGCSTVVPSLDARVRHFLVRHGFATDGNWISWDSHKVAAVESSETTAAQSMDVVDDAAAKSDIPVSEPVTTPVEPAPPKTTQQSQPPPQPPAVEKYSLTTAQLLRLYAVHRSERNRTRLVLALGQLERERELAGDSSNQVSAAWLLESVHQRVFLCCIVPPPSPCVRQVWLAHGFAVQNDQIIWGLRAPAEVLLGKYKTARLDRVSRWLAREALHLMDELQHEAARIGVAKDIAPRRDILLNAVANGSYSHSNVDIRHPSIQHFACGGYGGVGDGQYVNYNVYDWGLGLSKMVVHQAMETPYDVKRCAAESESSTTVPPVEQSKCVRATEDATATGQWKSTTGKRVPSTAQLLRLYAANTKNARNKERLEKALDQLDRKLTLLNDIMGGTLGMQLIQAAQQHEFSITATSCVPERACKIWIKHGFTVEGSSISWHLPGSVAQVLCRYSEQPWDGNCRLAAQDAMDILDQLQDEEFGCLGSFIPNIYAFVYAAAIGTFRCSNVAPCASRVQRFLASHGFAADDNWISWDSHKMIAVESSESESVAQSMDVVDDTTTKSEASVSEPVAASRAMVVALVKPAPPKTTAHLVCDLQQLQIETSEALKSFDEQLRVVCPGADSYAEVFLRAVTKNPHTYTIDLEDPVPCGAEHYRARITKFFELHGFVVTPISAYVMARTNKSVNNSTFVTWRPAPADASSVSDTNITTATLLYELQTLNERVRCALKDMCKTISKARPNSRRNFVSTVEKKLDTIRDYPTGGAFFVIDDETVVECPRTEELHGFHVVCLPPYVTGDCKMVSSQTVISWRQSNGEVYHADPQ